MSASLEFEGDLSQLSGLKQAPIRHRRHVSITSDLQFVIQGRLGRDKCFQMQHCCALRRHSESRDDEDPHRFDRRLGISFQDNSHESLFFEAESRELADTWLQRLDRAALQAFLQQRALSTMTTAESVVRVRIVGGKNMPGTAAPYCTVALGTQFYVTRAVPRTSEPQWDEIFFLRLPERLCASSLLIFTVMDQSILKKDDPMGSVALSLDGIGEVERVNTYPLQGVATGDIEIGLVGIGWPSNEPVRRQSPAEQSSELSLTSSLSSPDQIECRICRDAAIDSVLLPCSHSCMCMPCAQPMQSQECPICRTPIESVMKIFIG